MLKAFACTWETVKRLVSQAALIKTLTYGQNPVGKKTYLGKKRVSTGRELIIYNP